MHGIGIIGITWRQRRPDALAALTIPRDDRPARLPVLAAALRARELVYLATCNRVEVVFTTDGAESITAARRRVFSALAGREPGAKEADQTLRAWHGEGAVEHLFLVCAGLDSARVGESEITGQMRDALEEARALGLVGPELEAVFAESFKVAKRIRPITEGRLGRVSLAEVGMRHVVERLARTPGAAAVLAVSSMGRQCASGLAARGVRVIIVNRTLARAREAARDIGAEWRSLEAFRAAPDSVEALVTAAGAAEPVLRRADLERIAGRTGSGESPLVVDFGVPPNVAPEDASSADVRRVGMDHLSDEAASDHERVLMDFADARLLVDDALNEYRRRTAERLVGPMIALLRLRYRRTAIEGVERLFARELAGVAEPEREAIRLWAETLARRFAHLPSVGLRDLVHEAGPQAVEAFFSEAEPELAQQFRDSAHRLGLARPEP